MNILAEIYAFGVLAFQASFTVACLNVLETVMELHCAMSDDDEMFQVWDDSAQCTDSEMVSVYPEHNRFWKMGVHFTFLSKSQPLITYLSFSFLLYPVTFAFFSF